MNLFSKKSNGATALLEQLLRQRKSTISPEKKAQLKKMVLNVYARRSVTKTKARKIAKRGVLDVFSTFFLRRKDALFGTLIKNKQHLPHPAFKQSLQLELLAHFNDREKKEKRVSQDNSLFSFFPSFLKSSLAPLLVILLLVTMSSKNVFFRGNGSFQMNAAHIDTVESTWNEVDAPSVEMQDIEKLSAFFIEESEEDLVYFALLGGIEANFSLLNIPTNNNSDMYPCSDENVDCFASFSFH